MKTEKGDEGKKKWTKIEREKENKNKRMISSKSKE